MGKIPWRRKWRPTPVLLTREFHGQRSLAGYSSWSCKESDTTECLTLLESMESSCRDWWFSHLVMSDSCKPMDLLPARLLCPWVSQAGILEWVAISFFTGSFQSRNRTQVSCIAGGFFMDWTTREAYLSCIRDLDANFLVMQFLWNF